MDSSLEQLKELIPTKQTKSKLDTLKITLLQNKALNSATCHGIHSKRAFCANSNCTECVLFSDVEQDNLDSIIKVLGRYIDE